jgi:hypothetical protein
MNGHAAGFDRPMVPLAYAFGKTDLAQFRAITFSAITFGADLAGSDPRSLNPEPPVVLTTP